MKAMAETIFVGHQPGTYKVYKTIGGYAIMFLDHDGNSRNVDGNQIYEHRQNAYRRAKQLNQIERVQQGLKEVEASWWAGPYKTGKGTGKYYIHPNKHEPTQDAMLGFASLDALEEWIEQRRVWLAEREKQIREQIEADEMQ
jgi:hypothetical protein